MIAEAVQDLRYLLERGYARESAVRFVGDHYCLDRSQRLLLYRAIYPQGVAESHRRKAVGPGEVRSASVSVDGFNVLLTVDSALRGLPVYLCDDGFARDVSAIHGSAAPAPAALEAVIAALKELGPSCVHLVFDSPVSRSGEIASEARRLLEENSLEGGATAEACADVEVLKRGGIVATSDSVIIERANRVFDLGAYVLSGLSFNLLKI